MTMQPRALTRRIPRPDGATRASEGREDFLTAKYANDAKTF
jgi:hypothetical protein